MSKIITKFDPDLIRKAVNRIAEPVIQTLTPLGNNVLFEKDLHTLITNDGATIAKLIDSEDETEDAIIHMVKYGSLATNQQAGDGTSTTILLTKKLVDLGLDEIAGGVKPMHLRDKMSKMRDSILEHATLLKKDVTRDEWNKIAMISSGGHEELAANVVDVVETAGLDGMIFINESRTQKTRIVKDSGYNLEEGMYDPVLGNVSPGKADYVKPHIFITDKKLYHIEECKEILERGYESGVRELVIVARDFLGESPQFLIANHMEAQVPLKILLIKYSTPDNDTTPIYDLATYMGAQVVQDKLGSIKGKITPDHYTVAERVYSNGPKTVFVTDKKVNPELSMLVEDVRSKKEQNPEDNKLAKRLASLTSGTVNIEVGATTGPELRELIYRYEDAINATRAALRSGYVVGGGLTLYASTRDLDKFGQEFGKASIEQIALNCGIDFKESEYSKDEGYNAKTGNYSNLEQDGVIEPFDVFKYSVTNAFSIAIAILTSGYMIVNKIEKE